MGGRIGRPSLYERKEEDILEDRMKDRMEFNILFPPFLREAVEETAKRNRRSISAEITVAAERYITANVEDGPPGYYGNLKRTKIWIPKDVHQAVSDLAESRNWSMNQVFMAATAWHVRQENGSATNA